MSDWNTNGINHFEYIIAIALVSLLLFCVLLFAPV